MNRYEKANMYHDQGFNCCQSVLMVFSDLIDLPQQALMDMGAGFGGGAGNGELCGAITGAVMALGLLTPVDATDPLGSKKRTTALSKEFQKRFSGRFGALRCHDLLKNPFVPDETTPAARDLGLTKHCAIMIVTAVEIVEELLAERENV